MASYYSGWVATDDWRLRLDVTVTTSGASATYSTALNIENNYMYLSGGSTYLSWSITIDGATQSGTINRINSGQWLQLGTYSRTISKGTSSRTVGISFKASSPNNSISAYRSGASGSANQTLAALASHTVSYNANGGTGAPSNQTKWYGSILTLSSVQPTRTGHNFRIWNTAANGSGTNYSPGGQYGNDANVTLYAQWTAHTYTVAYNANGGSGAPGNQTKTYGVNLTLSSTRPTRTNYNFKGWATSSSATTAQYQPGGTYSANAAVTLYAVWELAYIAPRITALTATRCNSAGTLADDGTYAKVTFNWATDRSVSLVRINCNGVNTDISSSGTSGSVNQVVGAGALDTENTYAVTVTVTDELGTSTTGITVAPLAYIMDVAPNGSVSFGGVADGNETNFKLENPLIMHDVMRGFHEVGYTGNTTTWYYKVLARGAKKNNSDGSYGNMRIHGTLGGWGADTNGSIDLRVSTRTQNSSNIRLSAYDDMLYNNQQVRIIVRLGADGYIYLILARMGFYAYNLFLEGYQITLVDSAWSTSTGITQSGDDPFNSGVRYTTMGYPAKMRLLNGYWGLICPDDEDRGSDDWIRTGHQGLIPYQSGGSGALGTSVRPFNNAWINELNWTGSGLRGRVMKQLWSGTWVSGSITVPDAPYYNVFVAGFAQSGASESAERGILIRSASGNRLRGGAVAGSDAANTLWIAGISITINGSTLTMNQNHQVRIQGTTVSQFDFSIVRLSGLL